MSTSLGHFVRDYDSLSSGAIYFKLEMNNPDPIIQFLYTVGVVVATGAVAIGAALVIGRYSATKAEDILKTAAEASKCNSPLHGSQDCGDLFYIIWPHVCDYFRRNPTHPKYDDVSFLSPLGKWLWERIFGGGLD